MDSIAKQARDTVFGLVATWLGANSQNILANFASVPMDSDGNRYFSLAGWSVLPSETPSPYVAKRATNDLLLMPGVNLYFGADVASARKIKPRWYSLPVIFHCLVPWTDRPNVGEALAMAMADKVTSAFEGLGGRVQLYDFSSGSPSPVSGHYVSWVVAPQPLWNWKEAAQPRRDTYTNRMCGIEVTYVR